MGAELQSSDGVPDTVLILNDVESLSKIHADHTVGDFLCALFQLILLEVRIPAEWLSLRVSSGVHLTCIELGITGIHWAHLKKSGHVGHVGHVGHRCFAWLCSILFGRNYVCWIL